MRIKGNTITSFEQDKILTIPQNADSISWDCLLSNDNNAMEITVEEGHTKYITNGTVLIDKENKSVELGIKNAIIPDDGSVCRIGRDAFLDIEGLSKLDIPNTVKYIGYRAFAGSDIEEMILPKSVKEIDDLAFWKCKALKKIFIPKTVEKIGNGILAGCDNLKEIVVDKENKKYMSLNNCLIEKESMTAIAVINNAIIPDGVRAIGKITLFMNNNCPYITIPSSVKEIKEHEICENFKFCGVYSKDDNDSTSVPITIITEKNSYAEQYAKDKNIKYKTISTFKPYPINFINAIFGNYNYGDGIVLNDDLMNTIETLLIDLTKEERDVFDYFFVNNMPKDEIAMALDITEEDVDGFLARMLRRVRHPSKARFLKSFLTNNGIEECYYQEEFDFEDK